MVIPKPLPKYFFPLLIIIILAGMLFFWQKGISNKPKTTPAADLAKPTATAEINRTFEFKIKDPKNQSMTLKYTLLSAKKVNLITKDNQPVKLDVNKNILVIDIELQNDGNYALKVNTQDFVRLVQGDKKFAADYFNDVLDVPALSVKKDELAYIVDAQQKQFKFQVGEIDKEKTEIEINF